MLQTTAVIAEQASSDGAMAAQVQKVLRFGGVLQPSATPRSDSLRSSMQCVFRKVGWSAYSRSSQFIEPALCQRSRDRAVACGTLGRQVLVAAMVSEALRVCQASSTNDPTKEGEPTELTPNVIHWILAIILGIALVAGLVHVYRVLQKEDAISPVRRTPPEGMRAVQCGACHSMQHVTVHGRIFICYSCHNANRIAMDISSDQQQELVTATGPLRKFEFKREGENFFQETQRAEIEAGEEAAALAATAAPVASTTGTEANGPVANEVPESSPTDTNDAGASNEVQASAGDTTGDIEQGNGNAVAGADTADGAENGSAVPAQVIGRQASENPSESSRKSRPEWSWGLAPCVVCLDSPGNMVLLPCAHGSVCEECATRIAQNRASGGAHCPHCRADIETLVKITGVEGEAVKGVEFRIPIARTL